LVGITERLFSNINSWLYNLRKINMRSFNLDVKQLLSTAYHSGNISIEEIREALTTKRELNMPCGFAIDDHKNFYTVFFATDKENPSQVIRSKPAEGELIGERIKLNFRVNKDKRQTSQTPGQTLPVSPTGAPVLTDEQNAAVIAALQSSGALAAPKGTPPKVRQATQPTHVDPDTDIPF